MGVGIDAIEIDRVRTAGTRTPRLLERLFTPGERADCTTAHGTLRWGGLASRWAAKEAVVKAFGTGFRGFPFRDVEIVRDELGRPGVALHRKAAALADRLGVARVHLSMSTSRSIAVAEAVAEGQV